MAYAEHSHMMSEKLKKCYRLSLATGMVASLFVLAYPFPTGLISSALAQENTTTDIFGQGESISSEEQLLLESDDLEFDTDRGLVIASGLGIGTLFTLYVVPAVYLLLAREHRQLDSIPKDSATYR